MNNCLILLLLLFCCGNNGRSGSDNGCGGNMGGGSCGCGRESRNDGRSRNDSCREDSGRDRGFNSFPSPGGTCGCEEKPV